MKPADSEGRGLTLQEGRVRANSPSPGEAWGIPAIDTQGLQLLGGTINVCALPDHELALAIVGHFIAEGLRAKQRIALVAFENSNLTVASLRHLGWDFSAALESEQLVYLYYKPVFTQALSLTADYDALLAELRRLAGPVSRLAMLNAELLFNLQSQYLANASASKLAATPVPPELTVLACYVRQPGAAHRRLDASCASLMSVYLDVRVVNAAAGRYVFKSRGKLSNSRKRIVANLEVTRDRRESDR